MDKARYHDCTEPVTQSDTDAHSGITLPLPEPSARQRRSIARSVILLAGGTAAGQAITVLASPLLTRLYSPEDFGVLGVYASLLAILSVVGALRYELAIPLPENDTDAYALVVVSLGLLLVVSTILGLGVWILGDTITDVVHAPALTPYLWLLPFGVAIMGAYGILTYWALRRKQFRAIARTRLNQGIGASLIQCVLGVLQITPFGLLAGHLVGQSAGTGTLSVNLLRDRGDRRLRVTPQKIREVLFAYRRFPIYSSWGSFLNALSSQLPIVIMSYFFDTMMIGLYSLGLRVLQMPLTVIGQAVGQVFMSDAATEWRAGTLLARTERSFVALLNLGMALLLPFAVVGPELFAFAFGPRWRDAGTYAQFLVPWLILVFASSPLSILPSVLQRQDGELIFQIVLITARIGALVIGGSLHSPILAIILFATVSAFCWTAYLFWNLSLVAIAPTRVIRHCAVAVRYATPGLTILLSVKYLSAIWAMPDVAVCAVAPAASVLSLLWWRYST